ncbi:MAG: Origin recognition complex subunit 2 [Marteilia pararefringens]
MNHLMLNDEDSRSYFLKLLMFLKFGFTPLIYGLGDKLGFIKEFTDKCLPKYYCLIVEPSEDFRFSKILNEIFVKILNYKESLHSDNIFEDLDEIMSENDFEICLIIINADNEYFTKYLKEIFSLSSITNLHLIMTFEYINSEMLFHDELLKNAIFMNINTFEFGNFIQNPEVATKIALKANHKDILLIADSLPKSAKEVLAIIGKMRINNQKIFDEQD